MVKLVNYTHYLNLIAQIKILIIIISLPIIMMSVYEHCVQINIPLVETINEKIDVEKTLPRLIDCI